MHGGRRTTTHKGPPCRSKEPIASSGEPPPTRLGRVHDFAMTNSPVGASTGAPGTRGQWGEPTEAPLPPDPSQPAGPSPTEGQPRQRSALSALVSGDFPQALARGQGTTGPHQGDTRRPASLEGTPSRQTRLRSEGKGAKRRCTLLALFAGEFKRSLGRMWGAMYVYPLRRGGIPNPGVLASNDEHLVTLVLVHRDPSFLSQSFSLSQGLVQKMGCSASSLQLLPVRLVQTLPTHGAAVAIRGLLCVCMCISIVYVCVLRWLAGCPTYAPSKVYFGRQSSWVVLWSRQDACANHPVAVQHK